MLVNLANCCGAEYTSADKKVRWGVCVLGLVGLWVGAHVLCMCCVHASCVCMCCVYVRVRLV